MKKDKAFYFSEGAKWAASNVKYETPMAKEDNTSWQAMAFKEGIASVEKKVSQKEEPQEKKIDQATLHHLKCLMVEFNNTSCHIREDRIVRKIKSLGGKHGLTIQQISYMVN